MNRIKGNRTSRQSCCVVGCTNRVCNTSNEIQFYSFPKKSWEQDKREKWIQAVNRKNPDGSRWMPTASSYICSAHFIGKKKSGHPMNPAFVPTIFPDVYKVQPLTSSQANRFHRLHNRNAALQSDVSKKGRKHENPPESVADCPIAEPQVPEEPKTRDASTQTDLLIVEHNVNPKPVFKPGQDFCYNNLPPKPIMVDKETSVVTPMSGMDTGKFFLHCAGFHGFPSITDESEIQDLAGVTMAIFTLLLSYLPPNLKDRKVRKEDRLLIFLMKMKTGFTFSALRVLFGVHRSTISNIFKSVLAQLTIATKNFVFWPSRSSVLSTMPKEFKVNYPNCRVIIDCSEIRVEQPKEVSNRIFFYSNYKSGFTMKFLIGISPSGMITFISKCYGGRSSDSAITVDSQLLDLLEPGDDVMADKGFPGIKTILEDKHVVIVMPPFNHNGGFSEKEVDETYKVASVRIHVERMIQRVKVYNILQKVSVESFPYIDNIVRMCCVLANLQSPIIKNDL